MPRAEFNHQLYYPEAKGLSVREVANTLLANEAAASAVAEVLESLIPGLTIETIEIQVDRVVSGSLLENFLVAFVAVYQRDLDKEVASVAEALTGIHIPDEYRTLFTLLFFLVILSAARGLTSAFKRTKEAPPAINGDYNTYVSITARSLELHPEAVDAAVQRVTDGKPKRQLARAAIDIFKPAKKNGSSAILSPGTNGISEAAVAEFPAALSEIEDDLEPEPIPDAIVEIRAVDRDKRGTGWAGIIHQDGLGTRLPMRLYPTVEPEQLATAKTIKADVLVEWKRGPDGEGKPVRFHVISVHEVRS